MWRAFSDGENFQFFYRLFKSLLFFVSDYLNWPGGIKNRTDGFILTRAFPGGRPAGTHAF